MPTLTPVDYDPFGSDKPSRSASGPRLTPVSGDPFKLSRPTPTTTPTEPTTTQRPQPSSGLLRRTVGDTAVDLGRGIIGVGEAAVGLANIPTFGYAGKGLEAVGYDPKTTKEMIGELHSPERKAALAEVDQAEGFTGTAKAMLRNPSTIAGAVAESAPSILGGGAIARGLGAVSKLSRPVRAAIGEGAVGAGGAAEGIRQQTEDGTLSGKQVAAALGTGATTALLGYGGGRLAQRLGIGDVDTVLAGAGRNAIRGPTQTPGLARRTLQGAATEGVLEEMPQSATEQMWQNLALDRPLTEGVPESAAAGMLTGTAIGGPFAALSRPRPTVEPAPDIPDDITGARARALERMTPQQREEMVASDAASAARPEGNLTDTLRQQQEGQLLADIEAAETPEDRAAAEARLAEFQAQVAAWEALNGNVVDGGAAPVAPAGPGIKAAGEAVPGGDPQRNLGDDAGAQGFVAGVQTDLAGAGSAADTQSALSPGQLFPRAAPRLPDGSPVPDPSAGPLSRAVNEGVASGAVATQSVPPAPVRPAPGSVVPPVAPPWVDESTGEIGQPTPNLVREAVQRQTEAPTESATEGNPVMEIPVAGLVLSEDVPQFKSGASDETGVVEPLGGSFDRRGVGPIQVWRRNDGRMEVISGRHRLDLARRSGESTIPAQVYDESSGFTAGMAASLDAELNIRDGQGKVKDYVQFFQQPAFDGEEGRQAADARGLLARATGRRAYTIASQGSPELIAAHSVDQVTDEAAVQVAQAAPNNEALQNLGLKLLADGRPINVAVNTMHAAKAMQGPAVENGDLFGFDDSAIQDAVKMAGVAVREQRTLADRIAAIRGASKRPDLARKEGVDVRNPKALESRLRDLTAEKARWENWSSHPDLVGMVRQELGIAEPTQAGLAQADPEPESTEIDPSQQGFELRSLAEPTNDAPPQSIQEGLFAPPTRREELDAEIARRDAARNGQTATGRTDMMAGDGELFAGPRPAQATIPDEPGGRFNVAGPDRGQFEFVSHERRTRPEHRVDANGNEYTAHVADWDRAETSAGSGRKIVEIYWMRDRRTGQVHPFGIETAPQAAGKTRARFEQDAGTKADEIIADLSSVAHSLLPRLRPSSPDFRRVYEIANRTRAVKSADPAELARTLLDAADRTGLQPQNITEQRTFDAVREVAGWPLRAASRRAISAASAENTRERITPDTAANMRSGDIVVDEQGNEYRTHAARHDWLEAHPIINGRAEVNADSRVMFLLTPSKAGAYPNRRNVPIYATGRNIHDQPDTPSKGKPSATGATAHTKLDDFGEKLEGARKDLPPSLKEELSDEQIASQPLSKIWPANAHESIEDDTAAALAFAARAEISAKPRVAYKLRRWVEQVKMLRDMVRNPDNARLFIEKGEEIQGVRGLGGFFAKVRMLTQLPREHWKRIGKVAEYPSAHRYKDGKQVAAPFSEVQIDGESHRFPVGKIGPDEVQNVLALLGAAAPSKGGLTAKDFEIRGSKKEGRYFINRKGDSEYRALKTFSGEGALEQARAQLRGDVAELEAAWEAVKARDNVSKADTRRDQNRERVGENRRDGKDVTEQMFTDAFSFKGVQFGNWVKQGKGAKDRQGLLNEAYDALLDLADILGIPSKAISLNGTLGLSLGARGSGRAAAHFERDNLVINLTKTRGAGSLAHEWFHSLDNYFSRLRGTSADAPREGDYITYKPEAVFVQRNGRGTGMTSAQLRDFLKRTKQWDESKTLEENAAAATGGYVRDANHQAGVRPQVERAFAELVEALNASPMAARARSLDKTLDGYWNRIIERGARSFENYVISKMAQRGWSNDFLANIRDWKEWADLGKNKERYPYLMPEEEAPVVEAFDKLFDTIESRTDPETGNVGLFSQPDQPGPRFLTSAADVQAAVRQVLDTWKGDKPVVRVVQTVAEARARGAKLPADAPTDFEGWWDGNATVWIVAGNNRDVNRALKVLSHEAIGHYGIERIMEGKDWARLVADVKRLRGLKQSDVSPKIWRVLQSAKRRYGQENDMGFAKEFLAIMAEQGVRSGLTSRVVAKIRQFLAKIGIPVNISKTFREAELLAALHAGRQRVTQGERGARQPSGRPAAAMAFSVGGRQNGRVATDESVAGEQGDRAAGDDTRRDAEIDSVEDVLRLAGEHGGTVYVRWSAGQEFDMAPDAASRDYVSGETHAGLSAVPISVDMGRATAAKYLDEYRFLRMKDGAIRAHVYAARKVGEDSDGYAAIRPFRHLGSITDSFLEELESGLGKRIDLEERIQDAELRLTRITDPAARRIVESSLEKARLELAALPSGRQPARALAFSQSTPTFYSAMLESVAVAKGLPKAGGTAQQWKGWMDGAVRRGEFKQSERDWLGVDAWLDAQDKAITREQLADFIRANEVQVEDVVLGGNVTDGLTDAERSRYDELHERALNTFPRDFTPAEAAEYDALLAKRKVRDDSRYSSYQLPGGENYRELLLTLPNEAAELQAEGDRISRLANPTDEELATFRRANEQGKERAVYQSSHFDQPNILAHVRFNERTDSEGRRVLFLEELQSDWAQSIRKQGLGADPEVVEQDGKFMVRDRNSGEFVSSEFGPMTFSDRRFAQQQADSMKGRGLPNMPFKATDEWAMLAFKRMVRMAAEQGFDRIAWTTGEIQAERYDLSKQVDRIDYTKTPSGDIIPEIFQTGGGKVPLPKRVYSPDELAEVVGKEIADRIANDGNDGSSAKMRSLSGDGLKIGGEGMRGFYDAILPKAVNKWAKPFGAKTGRADFGGDVGTTHAIDLTPKMRDAALSGLPMFSRPDSTARNGVEYAHGQEALTSWLASWSSALRLGGSRPRPVESRPESIGAVNRNASGAAEQGDATREEIREQSQRLIERAKADGFFWPDNSPIIADLGSLQSLGGAEHQVFLVGKGDSRFVIRATDNGSFGPRSDISPAQYLARLDDYSSTFPNLQTRLIGVSESAEVEGNAVIWTAQPYVRGTTFRNQPALAAAMRAHGWEQVGDDQSFQFRHTETGAVIEDAHTDNVFQDDNGDLYPFDVVVEALPSGGRYSRPDTITQAPPSGGVSAFSGRENAILDGIQSAIRNPGRTVLDAIKDKVEQWRPAWLGALTLRHLAELGEKYLPQIKQYADVVQQIATDRNVMQEEGGELAGRWQTWAKKNRAQNNALVSMMHDATISGVDPAEAYADLPIIYGGRTVEANRKNVRETLLAIREQMRGRSGDSKREMLAKAKEVKGLIARNRRRRNQHAVLTARWQALSPEAQAMYREVRDMYVKRRDQREAALIKRIKDMKMDGAHTQSAINSIRQQFESARVQAPYFPLQRFGEFWISATSPEGEPTYIMRESHKEWQKELRELKAAGFTIKASGRKGETSRALEGASASFVTDVIQKLQAAGAPDSVRDEIYQLYLQSLPDLSQRKHSIHRKAVAGYSQDAIRAFGTNALHDAHQIARMKHSHHLAGLMDVMAEHNDGRRQAPDADQTEVAAADALLSEMKKRHEWIMNPQDAKLTNLISSIGFVYYLGLTPAAALVNLSQTAITTFPALAANPKVGPVKAMNLLLAGMRDSIRTGGNLQRTLTNPEEQRAYQALRAMGAIDKTLAHNLAGIAEGDSAKFSPEWAKTMNGISLMFHKAEVVNREATGIAAYRAARGEGKSFDEAVKYASEMIWQTHFDYQNANRARFMQGNVAKTLLMFRQYSLGMTWFLARNFWQTFKGESKEVRRQAFKTLAGTLGMTAVFSGTLGLPVLGMVFSILNAAAASFGDDDEPWDAETEFRNFLADHLGADAARVVTDGPVNALTGANIASRVSLNGLWFRDADRELEGRDAFHNYLEQIAGPVGGIGKNLLVGKALMDEGHLFRGVETMLPKALKDGFKGFRYATEGVNNLRGDAVVDDLNAWQTLLQVNGFTPSEVSEQYEANRASKNYEQAILGRRARLMDAFAMATRLNDTEARTEVLEKIRAFNKANPELPITGDTIRRSIRDRLRYSARAEGGIILDRRLARRAREQARFNDDASDE